MDFLFQIFCNNKIQQILQERQMLSRKVDLFAGFCIYKWNKLIKAKAISPLRGDIHTQVAMLNVNMTFGGWGREGRGWGLLTFTLELWQNDIFLILIWNNFTIGMIMQLIFRYSSYKNVHYVGCILHVLFKEIKQHSKFST